MLVNVNVPGVEVYVYVYGTGSGPEPTFTGYVYVHEYVLRCVCSSLRVLIGSNAGAPQIIPRIRPVASASSGYAVARHAHAATAYDFSSAYMRTYSTSMSSVHLPSMKSSPIWWMAKPAGTMMLPR